MAGTRRGTTTTRTMVRGNSRPSVATTTISRAARITSSIRTVATVAGATTIPSSTMGTMAVEPTTTPSRSMVAGPRQRQASHTCWPWMASRSREVHHPRLDNLSTGAVAKLRPSHKLLLLMRWSRRSLQCLCRNLSRLPSSASSPRLARPRSSRLGLPQ